MILNRSPEMRSVISGKLCHVQIAYIYLHYFFLRHYLYLFFACINIVSLYIRNIE